MKQVIYPIAIVIFWTIVISFIFRSSIPIPSSMSYINKMTTFNFIPQGWGFFTRDPREDELILYKINGNVIEQFTKSNGDYRTFFGASRENRLINIETSIITSKINDSLWIRVKGGKKLNLNKNIYTDTLINNFQPNNVNGDFFVVKRERIPWAWAGDQENIVMPFRYVKVYVKSN